jgi:hypothetical protein
MLRRWTLETAVNRYPQRFSKRHTEGGTIFEKAIQDGKTFKGGLDFVLLR